MRECDTSMAAIALWAPTAQKWYGFTPRALMFGATASVLHYNTFSRILVTLVNRLFGIPLLAAYDDLGAPMLAALCIVALGVVKEAWWHLGAILKDSN